MRVLALMLACTAALFCGSASFARADSGDTMQYVISRGVLRCGVSTGVTGFSSRDAAGKWSGMDVDFCRAVAAAVLGNPAKVQFIPLSATARFPAIESNDVDILARNTTWTIFREAVFSVQFIGILYYDSEGFITRADSPFAKSATLSGARICVEDGTNQRANVKEYSAVNGWSVTPVVEPDFQTDQQVFLTGGCPVMTDDISALHAFLLTVPDPADFVIRPERIAKEPIGPLVRWDDGQWAEVVRAVYAALIDADERGLTQSQASSISISNPNPAYTAYLRETAPVGQALGLGPSWAVRVISSVGNYGEMYNRNLGAGSPLKLDPGPNKPWTEGGVLYAPPFQ